MSDVSLKGLRVAVAGAGVLGLSAAALAARRGAEVVVFDPGVRGDNASGVAAGMLSPALETVLEDGDAARYALFQQAYAMWPAFAAEMALPQPRQAAGAIQLGEAAKLDAWTARLHALSVEPRRLDAAAIRDRQPFYAGHLSGVFVQDDGRLDPAATLDALARVLVRDGVPLAPERLEPAAPPAGFDRFVVATGHDAVAWVDAAPEVDCLSPIKGHILRYALAGHGGATLRGEGGYLAPQASHVAFGATMEAGRDDRTLDPAVAADLHACAVALAPTLADVAWIARTGVRATTPDGLPLVGASVGGAVLAVGARRNGWLLAPLVAKAAVDALAGAPPRPEFDPARFGEAKGPFLPLEGEERLSRRSLPASRLP